MQESRARFKKEGAEVLVSSEREQSIWVALSQLHPS